MKDIYKVQKEILETQKEILKDPKQVKKINNIVRKNRFYQKLIQHQYHDLSNYVSFDEIYLDIGCNLNGLLDLDLKKYLEIKFKEITFARYFSLVWSLYEADSLPVYAIKEKLVDALINTNLPTENFIINKPFDIALILLPKYFTTPDNENVEYLVISYVERNSSSFSQSLYKYLETYLGIEINTTFTDDDGKEVSEEEYQKNSYIQWCFGINKTIIYSSSLALIHQDVGVKIDLQENDFSLNSIFFDPGENSSTFNSEKEFCDLINHFVTMLFIYFNTSNVDASEAKEIKSKNKGFQHNTSNFKYPILLGENYQRKYNKLTEVSDSKYTIKPHYRRGHMHTVRHGKNKTESKVIWFQPTYVNWK